MPTPCVYLPGISGTCIPVQWRCPHTTTEGFACSVHRNTSVEGEIFDASVTPLRILLRIAVLCGVYQYAAVPSNTRQNLKVAVTLLRIYSL